MRRRARADARAEAARRRHDRAPPRRRRVHLRRGDGAARVARGPARPAAHQAAVPGDRGALRLADGCQQRRVDHDGDIRARARRRRVRRRSASQSSTGTRVFSLSGNVANGGNYELPHGFPLKELIYGLGGGIPGGRKLKAVIPGGSSTVILTADEIEDVTLDFDSMTAAGTAIGSAAVIAIDDRCCIVQLGVRVSQFYEHESCGKCTPCRVGTNWADADPREDRGRARVAGRPGPPPERRGARQRQVPVPARRHRDDRDLELRRQVPRRVPGPHRRRRLPVPRIVVARPRARARRDARACPRAEVVPA